MTRAVIDTSVIVSAFIGQPTSAAAAVLQALRDSRLTFVASPLLLAELTGVLERPRFERHAGDGRGRAYVAGLRAIAEMHDDVPDPPRSTRDPDDDYLVALALAQHVDFLVSYDFDLLEAVTDLQVVTPAQLLGRL